MTNTIPKNQKPEIRVKPQYLTGLMMLYVTFSLIGAAVLYKLVKIGFLVGPGGILSLPFVLLMEDVIAEVYGYKISRVLLWYILISQIIFTFFVVLIVNLPSPSYWHGQVDYNFVFGNIDKGVPIMVIAIFMGRFLNLYVITKTKILMHGRLFWIRMIISCLAGDLVTLTILYPIVFSNLPLHEMMPLYLSDLFTRVTYSIVGGGPALLLVLFLKKKENIDVYDTTTNFNPFKLSMKD